MVVCITIALLIVLLKETNGDFANGILFFISGVFTTPNFILLSIIFGCTFLFGGRAGKAIIIDKKNDVTITIVYVSLTFLAIYFYLAIAGVIYVSKQTSTDASVFTHALLPALAPSLLITIPILPAWLFATYRMQVLKPEAKTSYPNMWTHKNTFAVGGLHEVGYAPNQDHLIVLSSQGQGIFDCIKGEKIARLHNGLDWWEDFNEETNSIRGFDVLADFEIPVSGLDTSDTLPKRTADGWSLIASSPEPDDKPFEKYLVQRIYLVSPNKKEMIYVGKDGACELRAFGFSETGNSFIVALSCDLVIWART